MTAPGKTGRNIGTKSFLEEDYRRWLSSPKGFVASVTEMFTALRSNWSFFKKVGINKKYFVYAVIAFTVVCLFKALGLGLLVPLANGIINNNFDSMFNTQLLSLIVKVFPGLRDLNNLHLTIMLEVIIFVFFLSKTILEYFVNMNLLKKRLASAANASRYVFKKYLSFGKQFFDDSSHGKDATILMRVPTVVNQSLGELTRLISVMIEFAVLMILMVVISYKLAIVALLMFGFFMVVTKKLNEKIKEDALKTNVMDMNYSTEVYNSLSRIILTKVSNKEDQEEEKFYKTSNTMQQTTLKRSKAAMIIPPMQDLIIMVLLIAFAGIIAYISVAASSESLVNNLVSFLLFQQMFGSMKVIVTIRGALTAHLLFLNGIIGDMKEADKYIIPSGTRHLKGKIESIEIKGLTFEYRPQKPVLQDVKMTIGGGQTTALVGRTGSGKSTIIHLLLRLYDCQPGTVFINGTDIREFDIKSLRDRISYVSQDILLFNDTLFNNLVFSARTGVSEADISKAVERAQLKGFVSALPEGIMTNIGEMGIKLSGGEKQRIAIARALLRDADIVILDEATSNIDSQTERAINDSLKEAFSGKTILIITHRLSSIHEVNSVIVLEKGSVIEQGGLKELIAKNGEFSRLWASQKL